MQANTGMAGVVCLMLFGHTSATSTPQTTPIPEPAGMVVLSEVMFDPLGSEFYDEFIEIYNRSLLDTIDLTGWAVGDDVAFDEIVDAGSGTLLEPKAYALILDQGYWENSTSYDRIIPDSVLVLTISGASFGQNGWTNSRAKPVVLLSPDQAAIDTYVYSPGNRPGHSDERINLLGGNDADNWSDSQALLGTPGFINSVRLFSRDLRLALVEWTANPLTHVEIPQIHLTLLNGGLEDLTAYVITLYVDTNLDSLGQRHEEIARFPFDVPPLQSGDSLTVSLALPRLPSGVHRVLIRATAPGDENIDNDVLIRILRIGYPPHSLIFNEIMYRPISGNPEWLELLNASAMAIQLMEWRLLETATGRGFNLADQGHVVESGDYVVFASDSSWNHSDAHLIPRAFPSLNNNGEKLVLLDPAGQIIDLVHYDAHWGGDLGVSLERINPNHPSQDSSNWASSAALTGSTPGAKNSVYTPMVPADAALTLAPNPFSPNGDGHEDVTIVQLELPVTTATVSLIIFDVMGRLVGELLNNAPTGSRRSLIWNGHGLDGRPLPTGLYILVVQAINNEQGILRTLKRTVVIANGF